MTQEVPTIAEMARAYAMDAVDHAKAVANLDLDYSFASIDRVELVLAQLHAGLPKGLFAKLFRIGPSPSDIETAAKMYGFYLGEVIRRAAGGEWELTKSGVCLVNRELRIWPTAKAHKRILNGDEDNVVAYFRVLMQERRPTDEDTKPGE